MKALVSCAVFLMTWSSVIGVQDYCNRGYKPQPGTDYELDLSKLNKDFTISHNQTTPPTLTSTQIYINVCEALTRPGDTPEDDYCRSGAYICRRVVNVKGKDERVTEVQDIAGDFEKSKLNAEFTVLDDKGDLTKSGAKYSLILKGGKVNDRDQSAHVTLECDSSQKREDAPSNPELLSYENGVLSLYWKSVFACAAKSGSELPPPTDDNHGNKEGMSGLGIFFTTVWVLAALYFVGGALYNYKVYNARGLDLIPHRDFWLDLPYLVKDLLSHLIDSILSRRRGGSSGYVAV